MKSYLSDEATAKWCRKHFDEMENGSLWAVPGCGMAYRSRSGNILLLVAMFPPQIK